MTATAALEHLMWTRLKVEDDMSRKSYEDLGSPGSRLAVLAARASIPDRLDATLTPALDAFAQTRSDTPTAPIVLFALRNKIVHPTGHEMTLYERFPGLMTKTWYLAWHYLVLLILHWLGYEGAHQRLLPPCGDAGDVDLSRGFLERAEDDVSTFVLFPACGAGACLARSALPWPSPASNSRTLGSGGAAPARGHLGMARYCEVRNGQSLIVPIRVLRHWRRLELLVPQVVIDEFERNRPDR